MMDLSNYSMISHAHGSYEILVSPTSLFLLGLPLLLGICCWGDRDSTVLPSCAIPSTPSFSQRDVVVPDGKGKIPLLSLWIHVVSENES
jgi:hypothetical protein